MDNYFSAPFPFYVIQQTCQVRKTNQFLLLVILFSDYSPNFYKKILEPILDFKEGRTHHLNAMILCPSLTVTVFEYRYLSLTSSCAQHAVSPVQALPV